MDTYLIRIPNKFTEILWYVFYTKHFTELIQTRTESLRNKQVFIEQFNLKGAIFYYSIYLDINYKPTFSL